MSQGHRSPGTLLLLPAPANQPRKQENWALPFVKPKRHHFPEPSLSKDS